MKKKIIKIIYSIVHYFGILKLFRFINRNKISIILLGQAFWGKPSRQPKHTAYICEHINLLQNSI